MVHSTMEDGKMGNRMESVPIFLLVVIKSKENGKMERDFGGWMKTNEISL